MFNWFDHLCALILLVIIPVMSLKNEQLDQDIVDSLPPKKHLFYTNGLMLIIGALLVMTSWNISDRPWHDLGFAWPVKDIYISYLILIACFFYLGDIVYGLSDKKKYAKKIREISFIIPLNIAEFKHYIFLALAAGLCEEIIFRGFLITYLKHVFSGIQYSDFWAVIIPAISFSISHIYQGWAAVLKIIILSITLGFIFLYSGSLLYVILIHILIDLISGWISVIESRRQT
ncbi:MAG: CPBP family intramembrane metalloprotease [Saprospiraceae bacterium]|nr:CPBP family intramembrane metalloprotease [Saprospiraceae bacterium]